MYASIKDSFKPIISSERVAAGQGLYRMATLLAIAGLGYWALTQPTEFDGFIKANKGMYTYIFMHICVHVLKDL